MAGFSKKFNIDKTLVWVFLVGFIIHLSAVSFIYLFGFQPFSGGYGDYVVYQMQAEQIAERVNSGNFSLENVIPTVSHYYPVIIGYIYAFLWPKMIVGMIFGVFLATFSAVLCYLIVLEIGGSKRSGFLAGFLTSVYPSYLFFGSLLLKDTLVIPLTLACLLFTIKLIKNFSWIRFGLLYLLLATVIHFRFYIGYALLFNFIFCWLLLYRSGLKKKVLLGGAIIVLLGFLPYFFGNGYYGSKTMKYYLNIQTIRHYREEAYKSSSSSSLMVKVFPVEPELVRAKEEGKEEGFKSAITFIRSPLAFLSNISKSFIYILLGPFPWQIRNARQLFVLIEMIPWYVLSVFIFRGIFISFKKYRLALPLIVFGFISMGVLALFITNFGIITRIRMPSFIALFCLIGLNFKSKKRNEIQKICYVTNVDRFAKFILFNQLKFLKTKGYQVHIVCSDGPLLDHLKKEGIIVKTIKFKRKISPLSDIFAFVRLLFYFYKEKFDIIHTHTPKPGFWGQLAAKILGGAVIVNTVHGFYFQKTDSWFKIKFFTLVEKIAAKCSNLVFFVNKEDMETAICKKICSAGLIKYFGGGINLSLYNPHSYSEGLIASKKKSLGIGPDYKIIGIVGRLVKEKGYLDILEAFKKISLIYPKTILLIVGPEEPEKKDKIDIQPQNNIKYLGERYDLAELYSIMDIFVLPSHREGLGISILEASAMKRPVVATDIRGCREAVDDQKTGILVPVKNSEKLAQAIIYLISNSAVAEKMGRNGRKKIQREFDERLVFGRIINEYKRLLKENAY